MRETHGRANPKLASDLQKRAIGIYEQALGPEHPFLATSLDNLSHMYRGQGRDAEAEALLKRALTIRDKTLGPDHPDVGMSLNNLAVLYAQKGEYAQARDELERTIATAPDYAVAHENLGDVYARLAAVEYEKATTLDKRNRTAGAKLKQIRDMPAN